MQSNCGKEFVALRSQKYWCRQQLSSKFQFYPVLSLLYEPVDIVIRQAGGDDARA
jgi:hypothetical protein